MDNNYYLNLCPDIKNTDDLYMYGDYTYNKGNATYFQFNITLCNSS